MTKLDEDSIECDDEDPAERDDEKRRDWPGLVSGEIVAINFWFLQQMPALSPKVIIPWDSNHHQSLHQFLGQSFLTMIFPLVLTFNLALTIALLTLLFAGQWSLKRISTYTLLINIFIIIMRTFHRKCKYELPEVIRVRLNPFPIPRNSKTDFGFCAFKLILILREPWQKRYENRIEFRFVAGFWKNTLEEVLFLSTACFNAHYQQYFRSFLLWAQS